MQCVYASHDDAIKWKGFRRCWPFVRGIHRSPVNFPQRDRDDLLIAGHLVGEIYPTQNAINVGLWCAFLLAETKFWTNYLAAGNSRRRGAHVTSLYWNALTPVLDIWAKTKNKETKMYIHLMTVSALKLNSGECPTTSLMTSQLWVWWRFGAVWQQASITTSTQLPMPHGVVGPYMINESVFGMGRRDDLFKSKVWGSPCRHALLGMHAITWLIMFEWSQKV